MRKQARILQCAAAVSSISFLFACTAPPPPPAVPEGAPADFPAALYGAHDPGTRAFEVDPLRSLVDVLVYRGGTLARLGHDHVIAARDLAGFVLLRDDGSAMADVYQPLAAMTVDEIALREANGFETTPSDDDRAGTRGNMLESLQAAAYPYVQVEVRMSRFSGALVTAPVSVRLHDHSLDLDVPLHLDIGADTVRVRGEFAVLQSDFGIEPFSVLGGALTVQDRIEVRFDVLAAARTARPDDGPVSD